MKKIIALVLALASLLTLAACGSNGNTTETPVDTTPLYVVPVDNFPYTKINQKLSWDAINAFPIKNENMTIEEMRQLCVDFMNFSKTALYIPNDNLEYSRNPKGTMDQMIKGQVYGGVPYIGQGGCGNVYRLMDYLDVESGVLDMTYIKMRPNLFGNHCSSCTYWGWGRVISSVSQAFTFDTTHSNGYLRVGPYTYDDEKSFSDTYTTDMIVTENGQQTMYKSYAEMHMADGLVNYHVGGGHVIMATCEPVVVYLENGDIDAANSYITISDQGQTWVETTNEAGDVFQIKSGVDKKRTFLSLFQEAYIPFTFAEFTGAKSVDKTECNIDISGETVDQEKLLKATVTCNYGISDVYLSLYNANGREVYRLVTRAVNAGDKKLQLAKNATNSYSWGDFESLSGEYTAKITVQLSTGERPELYNGKVTITQE